MNNFFSLSEEQKRLALMQTAVKVGLPVEAVEKDLWVTAILQAVFSLPYSKMFVFKGGTSLSKVWKRIERFSEDIDLAIDRCQFKLEGDLTIKQIKKLRKSSSVFVRDVVSKDLESVLDKSGLSKWCRIDPEPDGEGDKTYPEPRKIFVQYSSLFTSTLDYLKPVVMLEIGSRSLIEPYECHKVNSLVCSAIGVDTTVFDIEISTAVPEKTFLEKAFLLHELFSTDTGSMVNRKSRHLYDLEKMMDCEFALDAINNDELWNAIQHHRDVFTHIKDVDYTPDIRDRIILVPSEEIRKVWEDDYKNMQGAMIFGESLPFGKLLQRMEELQGRFRARAGREACHLRSKTI